MGSATHRGVSLVVASVTVVLVGTAAPEAARAASANVAALQVALRAAGFAPGPIDGITGPLTRDATSRFQARKHLVADGIAGPRTRRALGRRGRPPLGSRPMRYGNRGWDVAALQFLLAARGFGARGFDGAFGPNTRAAVIGFQNAVGLAADGIAGPMTLAALRRRPSVSAPAPSGAPTGPVRFLRPISGPITDGFGAGRGHTGIDIAARSGTPVGAAGVGVVAFAGWNDGGYGNLVVIGHRLGFESWYAHLSSVAVGVGQSVNGGTIIGYVGSTGRSTGPHLHFEVREYGTPIDPMTRMLGALAARAPFRDGARARRFRCRPNADAWGTRDADPAFARLDRCP